MGLDRRRQDEKRLKAKAERLVNQRAQTMYVKNHSGTEPKDIGKTYAVHGVACSCMTCGNPRKHFNQKTLQERRDEDRVEQLVDSYFGQHW